MTKMQDLFDVLTALGKAQQVLLFRNVPKNNPAARDFRKALKELVDAMDKF